MNNVMEILIKNKKENLSLWSFGILESVRY